MLAAIGLLMTAAPAFAADAQVSGRVIVSGVPLGAGKVVLYLGTGEFLGTNVGKDGSYAFQKLPVPTGTYTVAIEGKGVPAQYQDEKVTPLRIEVREGENTFDFDLQ
jgi:hypothetical protein